MPHFDAYIFNKKGIKRNLTLILDEGDGILESIKQGMIQHGLNEVKIEGAEGKVKEVVINYFEHNQFKSSVLKDSNVMLASGSFKLSYGDLYGSMKIATSDKPPMHGTLVKGTAHDGFVIKLSFVELIDK
jgi:hypothetical protein